MAELAENSGSYRIFALAGPVFMLFISPHFPVAGAEGTGRGTPAGYGMRFPIPSWIRTTMRARYSQR